MRAELANAYDSRSICSSTAARWTASASSSKGRPDAAADWRATMDSTPASCWGPMTADLALGQLKRNRGP
jgi:hypothetical protein